MNMENNNQRENHLQRVIFFVEENNRQYWEQEIPEAVLELSKFGIEAQLCQVMENDRETDAAAVFFDALNTNEQGGEAQKSLSKTLFLTDSAYLYGRILKKGGYAAGYLHGGNRNEQFRGAAYLIAEPQYVDEDSWQKIYERLAGLPWTILETKRCIIRELTIEDLDALYELYDDTDSKRFLQPLSGDKGKERELLRAYIEKVYSLYGYGYWAVISKEDGRMIGRAGFSPYAEENEDASLGYVIHRDYRQKGYALEVCGAIKEHAAELLGFTRIGAVTHADNRASRKLLAGIGFDLDKEEEGLCHYIYEP